MNWYQTSTNIEKIAFRNPLDILSNEIVKEISTRIRKNLNFDSWIKDDQDFPLLKELKIQYIEFELKEDNNIFRSFVINGKMDRVLNSSTGYGKIFIEFRYNSQKFNKSSWDKMYKDLIEATRHELEHAFVIENYEGIKRSDIRETPKNPWENAISVYNYLTNLSEREAFVRGILLKAKKENLPAEDIFQEYFLELIFGSKLQFPNRDSIIRQTFSMRYPLKNGLTIFEMYEKVMKNFKNRLAQVRRGIKPSDMKLKPGKKI